MAEAYLRLLSTGAHSNTIMLRHYANGGKRHPNITIKRHLAV